MPRIQKIGNSLFVSIPKEIVRELGLKPGETLSVHVEDGKIVYERIAPVGSIWGLVPAPSAIGTKTVYIPPELYMGRSTPCQE